MNGNYLVIALSLLLYTPIVLSNEHINQDIPDASIVSDNDYTNYPASFFVRFQPITALDMVNQVPGFQLDDNIDGERGFGNTSGNLLIDDRRPSAKQDSLSAILARIPAESVERIELIRGQIRNIDLRGQSTIVNIVLREDTTAAVQWRTHLERRFNYGHVAPAGTISLSDKWQDIEYNIGLEAQHQPFGRIGMDEIINPTGDLTEIRFDGVEIRNNFVKGNFNAASLWGKTLFQLNSNIRFEKNKVATVSRRVPQILGSTPRRDLVAEDEDRPSFEAGFDAERDLSQNLTGKLIFLYNQNSADSLSTQRNINNKGIQTLLREANSQVDTSETIARLEFDWSGISNHLIQGNLERAFNVLDSSLLQTDDSGAGPVIIDVPGANSRVEEIRWDFLLKDTWVRGQFEFDYGIGAEASTITQSGDVVSKRDFFFIKPQVVVTYATNAGDQTRLKMATEVSQLDLKGFVSATVFDEDDLALGNPNIQPDTTWVLELTQEKRFGDDGVVRLTAFHHWISDVLDLLPLSTRFEARGNIGDGRRWGVELDTTIPLDRLGLVDAKLNFKARWQDSTVVDPVTDKNRVLSIKGSSGGGIRFNNENKYAVFVNYRQDFQTARVAWGWSVIERAERFLFKANELEIFDEGMALTAFIETTRWFGVKMQLSGENILNFEEERIRTIFTEERDLSPLAATQLRHRTRGAQLFFTVSGAF
ncbi:MAG: hypothetical protein ACI9XC_000383 [Gammaproteobacteria bacterium]|jgi:hypothetical protein